MGKKTKRGQEISSFIIRNVQTHPHDLVSVVCKQFNITRQAVYRYIQELMDQGFIAAKGKTRQRVYSLKIISTENFSVPLSGLEEDQVWRTRVGPLLYTLPENVIDIWHYSFTEMVNNAIDHSGGNELLIAIEMNAYNTEIIVRDDGIGIFRKIKEQCHLEDERHAVLELAKGKLTTDPEKHTGEGIFFTSRMLDDFNIFSGDVIFSHTFGEKENWILEREKAKTGTSVFMCLANSSTRTSQEVFNQFASDEEDYGFTKTVVPVRLVRHGAEKLISRSQAKRLLSRIDRFNIVIFDFTDVNTIGNSFADEIFRVYERSHPSISLIAIHTSPEVDRIIKRARSVVIE